VGWLIYSKINAHPGTAVEPTTQPLVERLRAERERRMRERGELPPLPATTSRPQTQPSTAPAL